MPKVALVIVAALGRNRELGLQQKIPWHISSELKHFKKLTLGKTLLMGRKTFSSVGRALPGRQTLVLTSDRTFSYPGVERVASLADARAWVAHKGETELIIAGGAQLYQEALPLATRMHLSFIDAAPDADVFFPEWDPDSWEVLDEVAHSEDSPSWVYRCYGRVKG